jgi:hypothetical protein
MLSPRMIDQPAHGKKARLFHIKGKQQILVTKTVVSARSLNDGDVFVLDSGDGRVFLWNGTYARQVERTKGAYLATRLAEEESSELTVIEKGSEPAAFWEVLGGAEQVLSADEGGDDDEVSRTQMARRVLYRVVDAPAGPRLERVDVDTSVLTRTVLSAAHAYVLDINHEVFVWAGMEASGTHKFAGMQQAEDLIKDRAPHVDISWVLDGGELVFFREQFADWQDDKQMRLAEQMQTQQQMTYALQLEAGVGAQPAPSAPLDPLKLAVVKFNSKPKDGVKFMIKQKLCRKTAKDVARLLWQLPQINMAQLGDYLSEKSEFNQAVLLEFVRHIDLRGRSFDSGLREFLQHFRLPGEAQKIDRIMERFAAQLVEQNPSLGLSPDTCFVLAFATIMLNTDAAQLGDQEQDDARRVHRQHDAPQQGDSRRVLRRALQQHHRQRDQDGRRRVWRPGEVGLSRQAPARRLEAQVVRAVQQQPVLFQRQGRQESALHSAARGAPGAQGVAARPEVVLRDL